MRTMTTIPPVKPYALEAGAGDAMFLGVHDVIFKATSLETEGRCSIFEAPIPVGDGVPMHIHRREDELFYILEGEFTIWVGEETIVATTGMFAFLPKGVPHAFRNTGTKSGRLLTTATPGGIEGMFGAFAEFLRDGEPNAPETLGRMAEIASRYGCEFLPPPAESLIK